MVTQWVTLVIFCDYNCFGLHDSEVSLVFQYCTARNPYWSICRKSVFSNLTILCRFLGLPVNFLLFSFSIPLLCFFAFRLHLFLSNSGKLNFVTFCLFREGIGYYSLHFWISRNHGNKPKHNICLLLIFWKCIKVFAWNLRLRLSAALSVPLRILSTWYPMLTALIRSVLCFKMVFDFYPLVYSVKKQDISFFILQNLLTGRRSRMAAEVVFEPIVRRRNLESTSVFPALAALPLYYTW